MKNIITVLLISTLTSTISFAGANQDKTPCGLNGSIEERIKDCSPQSSPSRAPFVLVSRTKLLKEVHIDTSTGLLWGDTLPNKMDHYQAQYVCDTNIPEVAGLSMLAWRLPKIEEFKKAYANGSEFALPNMYNWFWSSDLLADKNLAYVWNTPARNAREWYRGYKDDVAVRCVAKLKSEW